MPCIMWEHYFDYGLGGCIKHLVEVRWASHLAIKPTVIILPAHTGSILIVHLLMLLGLKMMMMMVQN